MSCVSADTYLDALLHTPDPRIRLPMLTDGYITFDLVLDHPRRRDQGIRFIEIFQSVCDHLPAPVRDRLHADWMTFFHPWTGRPVMLLVDGAEAGLNAAGPWERA